MEKRKGGMRKEKRKRTSVFFVRRDANILENEQGKWADWILGVTYGPVWRFALKRKIWISKESGKEGRRREEINLPICFSPPRQHYHSIFKQGKKSIMRNWREKRQREMRGGKEWNKRKMTGNWPSISLKLKYHESLCKTIQVKGERKDCTNWWEKSWVYCEMRSIVGL